MKNIFKLSGLILMAVFSFIVVTNSNRNMHTGKYDWSLEGSNAYVSSFSVIDTTIINQFDK